MTGSISDQIQKLYHQWIEAWNHRDAKWMAELFSEQGVQIGFDGSKAVGKAEIFAHLNPILEGSSDSPLCYQSQIRPAFGIRRCHPACHSRDDSTRKNGIGPQPERSPNPGCRQNRQGLED